MWMSSWSPSAAAVLAAGVSTLAKLLNPHVKVIGVEPTGAASMKASLEAGHVVTLDKVVTIADGVAVKTPGMSSSPSCSIMWMRLLPLTTTSWWMPFST